MLRALPICGVFMALSAAAAQPIADPLGDVTSANLLIQATEDAKACGVTESLIRQAAMFPISANDLEISQSINLGLPDLDIAVQTLRSPTDICFSSVRVSVHSLRGGDNVLWEGSNIGYSNAYQHPEQIRQIVETLTKNLLTAWNLARKNVNQQPFHP